MVLKLKVILLSRELPNLRNQRYHGQGEMRTINNYTYLLTLYRSYYPYMGHKRFYHCHAEKVGT
jgi:hypothetical protein